MAFHLPRRKTDGPTEAEKRSLRGSTNIEALLNAIDGRLQTPATLVLVGRASYELGDEFFTREMRETLGEPEKLSPASGRLLLTRDVDCYCGDEAEEAAGIGRENSYVSKMAECYLHSLGEQTLLLPTGWQERTEQAPFFGLNGKLTVRRLNEMDFIICKGAAGRAKDIEFLTAFCRVSGIGAAEVRNKVNYCLEQDPNPRFKEHSARHALGRLATHLEQVLTPHKSIVDLQKTSEPPRPGGIGGIS